MPGAESLVNEGMTPFVRPFAALFVLPFAPTTAFLIWVWWTVPPLSLVSASVLVVGDVVIAFGFASLVMSGFTCRRIKITSDGIVLRPDTPKAKLWSWTCVTVPEPSRISGWLFGHGRLLRLLDGDSIVDACLFTTGQYEAILSFPERPPLAPIPPMNWGLQT
jgi:hypothetical protein